MVEVKEIPCKTVLSRSKIYGVDYAINPYVGCMHGCRYCYARFMAKFHNRGPSEWGSFVYVKINAPRVLMKDLRSAKRGIVLLSSVTDPYQPIEEKYGITRTILEILARKNFPVSILTKSSLVVRDVDVLKRFNEVEVGFTIVTLDERVRMVFEPGAAPVSKRLDALKTLSDENIPTYVFFGPVLPFLSDHDLEDFVKTMKDVGVREIMVDKLRIKYGNWETIASSLRDHYPHLLEKYRRILFGDDREYFGNLKKKISLLCQKYGIMCDFCY